MATQNPPVSDDKTTKTNPSKDMEELQISPEDLASKEIESIIRSVPKLSLEASKGKPLSQIDQLIDAIKQLDEREERAKEKSATSTEFDKIRREISRQRRRPRV